MAHINKMLFKSTNKRMQLQNGFGVILRTQLHKRRCKLKSCCAKLIGERERERERERLSSNTEQGWHFRNTLINRFAYKATTVRRRLSRSNGRSLSKQSL